MNTLSAWRPSRLACLLTVTIAALAGSAAASADVVQDAQQLIADGKQTDAIKLIDQQIVQRRNEISNDERYQLLMLKGEALIQTNKSSMAGSAFEQARRTAPSGPAGAIARANMLLVRASPTNKYTPKTPGSQPIDIVNPESRRMALEALRNDLANAVKPKIDRATAAKTLPQTLDLLPALMDVASVELAAKGSTEQTQADVAALGEHTREMMKAQLARVHRHLNGMADMAYSVEEGNRRGLFSNEVKQLQPMITEVRKIEKVARDVRGRAQELGLSGSAWEQIAVDAADIADNAERVMEAGSQSTRSPSDF